MKAKRKIGGWLKKLTQWVNRVFFSWTIGNLAGLLITLPILLFKRVEIRCPNGEGWISFKRRLKKKMAETGMGVIMASNHESMGETPLPSSLFWPDFLFSARWLPYVTPDSNYFFSKWFAPLRFACVPIYRDEDRTANPNAATASLLRLVGLVRRGGIAVWFPEGGRRSSRIEAGAGTREENERIIARFKPEIERLFKAIKSFYLIPMWIEGGSTLVPNRPKERGKHRKPVIGQFLGAFWSSKRKGSIVISISEPRVYSGESIEEVEKLVLWAPYS